MHLRLTLFESFLIDYHPWCNLFPLIDNVTRIFLSLLKCVATLSLFLLWRYFTFLALIFTWSEIIEHFLLKFTRGWQLSRINMLVDSTRCHILMRLLCEHGRPLDRHIKWKEVLNVRHLVELVDCIIFLLLLRHTSILAHRIVKQLKLP